MAVDLDIVGNAAVDVVPIAPGFHEKLKAMVLPGADKLGDELGRIIANAMSIKIAAAIPKAVADGSKLARGEAVKQGSSTGGAFADSLRAKLTAAFRAMPKLDIGLSDTGVDAQLARLRAKLEDLRNKRIGVDISVEDANAKLSEIDERLARLGASSPNVAVRVDVATARAAIADIKAEIAEASRSPIDIPVRVGEFRTKLLAQVEAAQASLPYVELSVDTTSAQLQLDEYRADLAEIPGRLRTEVGFSDAEAVAEIERLRVGLADLSRRRTATIDVRADAARAEAELAVISTEVEALNAERVDLDFGPANAGALELAINLAILTAIPAIPILGAGVGALAAAFTAAGAGAGAFGLAAIPAIKNVTAAMAAQTAAKNDDSKASSTQANAGVSAAQQALSMASAQQALASAERSAAQSIHSADEQIANSQRAVANAVATAADQRMAALAGVKAAEQSLADAQRSSKDAEDNLVQARATAAKQLRDLNAQLADGQLSARSAALQVQRTKVDLTAAKANPNTNPLDLADAQLSYDQALQAQKEQAQSLADLKKSAAEQAKAGVDGNDAVKHAAEELADAQRKVVAQTQAVADAQLNVAKVAKASAQTIADAQRQEADAYTNAANARASAADSITSAERGIESARLSASKTTATAVSKEDEYRKALAKLSPSARQVFDALAGPHGLKKAFTDWQTSLQPTTLPIFVRGINAAKGALPGLTPLVKGAAAGISTLFDKASASLKSPFWERFKTDIASSVEPAIVGLGVAFGNTFKGLAGIVDAFLPHIDGINREMARITGRFAKWGAGLKGSPDFEHFIAYVVKEGPVLAKFLGDILRAATDVSEALSPVSQDVMGFLSPILDGIGWLSTNVPEVVRALYLMYLTSKLVALGLKLMEIPLALYNTIVALASIETWSWAAALAATGISELVMLIVVVIGLLVLGVVEAYKHVGWFRAAVDSSWKFIKEATVFLWNDVLKPAFKGMVTAFKALGTAAVWLWEHGIKPTFKFMWDAARLLVTIFLTVLITPIYLAIKFVWAPLFLWLWSHAIKPAFDHIGAAAEWLWKKSLKPSFEAAAAIAKWLYDYGIKPMAEGVRDDFKMIGDAVSWLWTHAIHPIFGWIGDRATWLYDKALKPAFKLIKQGIGLVGDSFKTAKDEISVQWGGLEDIAKKPVKFILQHVYNEGIVPVWNGVAKVTGVKPIGKIDLKGWNTGGVLPGFTPGRDPHEFFSPTGGRIALSGGEAIMRPEFTAAVGSEFVDFFNRIATTQGTRGVQNAMGRMTAGKRAFSSGGILGSLGKAGGSIWNAGSDLVGLAADPGKVFDKLLKSAAGSFTGLGTTPWVKMVEQLPTAIVKGLKDKAVDLLKSVTSLGIKSDHIGGGVSRWRPDVMTALQLTGQSPELANDTLRRMNQESGGNPTIVNRTDSNWLAGHPSVGLMQVIEGTFREYAGPFKDRGPFEYGVSVDPVANIYASMKYALSRYGSLASAYNRPGGYDEGGYLPPGDFGVYNHTGKPEPVFTAGQWEILKANIDGRGHGAVNVNARVFVGDREITDIVRTEIDVYDADTARGLDTGRKW